MDWLVMYILLTSKIATEGRPSLSNGETCIWIVENSNFTEKKWWKQAWYSTDRMANIYYLVWIFQDQFWSETNCESLAVWKSGSMWILVCSFFRCFLLRMGRSLSWLRSHNLEKKKISRREGLSLIVTLCWLRRVVLSPGTTMLGKVPKRPWDYY